MGVTNPGRYSGHTMHRHECPGCGAVQRGNAAPAAHQKACAKYREKYGVFVPKSQRLVLLADGWRTEDIKAAALKAAADERDEL